MTHSGEHHRRVTIRSLCEFRDSRNRGHPEVRVNALVTAPSLATTSAFGGVLRPGPADGVLDGVGAGAFGGSTDANCRVRVTFSSSLSTRVASRWAASRGIDSWPFLSLRKVTVFWLSE